MNSKKFNKLVLASAVSVAISGQAFAEEADESIRALKVVPFNDMLIVNAVIDFTEDDVTETFVESALLNRADALPVECDPVSAHPTAEESNDNPDFEITGDWQASSELYLFDLVEEDDEDEDDEDMDDEDMDDEEEEDEGEDDEDEDEDEDDEDEDDEDEDDEDEHDEGEDDEDEDNEDEGDEDDEDGDDEDEDDEDEEDEDESEEDEPEEHEDLENEDFEDEMEEEGEYQQYLSLSTDGFIVLSEYEEEDGIGTCEVTYLGELVGDTFTVE